MLLIKCPWCGVRDETDFSYGGEAGIKRPLNPADLNDQEWADYLFMRKNTRGLFLEHWNHSLGCRQWLIVERDTVTYEIISTSKFQNESPNSQVVS